MKIPSCTVYEQAFLETIDFLKNIDFSQEDRQLFLHYFVENSRIDFSNRVSDHPMRYSV